MFIVADSVSLTLIKNKYLIKYFLKCHWPFLHLQSLLQQYLLGLSKHMAADILQS